MELWEGAILVIGGVWLVGHMTQKTQQAVAAATAGAGVSNASNLTTITNQAGGIPAVAGESLTPPNPPLIASPKPVFGYSRTPLSNPRISQAPVIMGGTSAYKAVSGLPPVKPPVGSDLQYARPMSVHL